MKKNEAIKILELSRHNPIHFSNINSAVNVWWLDIPQEKFENKVYIILNDNKENKLYFLEIDSLEQKEKDSLFVRKSNNKFQLEIISESDKKFICRKSNVNFKKYITRSKET